MDEWQKTIRNWFEDLSLSMKEADKLYTELVEVIDLLPVQYRDRACEEVQKLLDESDGPSYLGFLVQAWSIFRPEVS